MKFTPETLLQIYLNGSFTEEAQAEFDRLIRRDPAFAEQVTQAVAERLGPVPEATIENLTANLDPKMEALWALHKPSPLLSVIKLTGKVALCLAGLGALYFASGPLYHKILSALNGGLAGPSTQTELSQTNSPSSLEKSGVIEKDQKGTGVLAKKQDIVSFKIHRAVDPGSVPFGIIHEPMASKNMNVSTPENAPPVSSRAPANTQKDMASNLPLISSSPSDSSTAEGNALRVDINTPKTQNVIVTVFDANGLLIRHLYQGVLDAGEHYVDWDGKDELGNAVPPGDYTVVLDLGGKKMSGVLKVLPNK